MHKCSRREGWKERGLRFFVLGGVSGPSLGQACGSTPTSAMIQQQCHRLGGVWWKQTTELGKSPGSKTVGTHMAPICFHAGCEGVSHVCQAAGRVLDRASMLPAPMQPCALLELLVWCFGDGIGVATHCSWIQGLMQDVLLAARVC